MVVKLLISLKMKAIKLLFAILIVSLTCSSCLEANLKELDTYDGKDITSSYVFYRYVDNSNTWALSGAHYVKQITMAVANSIDTNRGTCDIAVSVPSNFPEGEIANLSAKQLVVSVAISTAAVISPKGNSPALGTPADWSTPHEYVVTAADGQTKDWTISVTLTK